MSLKDEIGIMELKAEHYDELLKKHNDLISQMQDVISRNGAGRISAAKGTGYGKRGKQAQELYTRLKAGENVTRESIMTAFCVDEKIVDNLYYRVRHMSGVVPIRDKDDKKMLVYQRLEPARPNVQLKEVIKQKEVGKIK